MTAKRPRRQHRGDRLISSVDSPALTAVDHAIAPFDRAMREAEARWGIDRLPELVSPETAAKWGKAIGELNAAIRDDDAEAVAQWVGVCLRGLPHLEAEAEAAGHDQVPPAAYEWREDGQHFVVCRDIADWPRIERLWPGVPIYSMREIAMALKSYGDTVIRVKEQFPGSEVKAVRQPTPLERELNDEIVF